MSGTSDWPQTCLTCRIEAQMSYAPPSVSPPHGWQVTGMLDGAGAGLLAGHGHCAAILQSVRQQEERPGCQDVTNQAQLSR